MSRKTLGIKTMPRKTWLHDDLVSLASNEKFLRTVFTFLESAGMFNSGFHSEVGAAQFGEGRRSLGLNILSTLADAAFDGSQEEALIAVLQAEKTIPKEATHDRRNHYDRDPYDGHDDD